MATKAKPKQTAYSVAIKPAPDVREALRRTAEAAGRTLNKEIELRLAASVRGDQVALDLYSGWPSEDQLRFRSLGNVIGLLCERLTLTYGSGATAQDLLKGLRVAVDELFTSLGVSMEVSPNDAFFAMIARQLIGEIRHSTNIPSALGAKAALAEFAIAWGVNEQTAQGHGAGRTPS